MLFFKKNLTIILVTLFSALFFIIGFKLAIRMRANYEEIIYPEEIRDKYYIKYDPKNLLWNSVYLEALYKRIISTKKEYNKYRMEVFFLMETRPFFRHFVKNQSANSTILDVGGSTGIHWRYFGDDVVKKNLKIYLVDIDKKVLEIGKSKNRIENLKFYHTTEVDKIEDKNVDIILFSEVYMQIPNASKVLKGYLDKFPNAKAIVMHSIYENKMARHFVCFLRKFILPFTFLSFIYGRVMTNEIFHSEMNREGLKITEERDITNINPNKILLGRRMKLYTVERKIDN